MDESPSPAIDPASRAAIERQIDGYVRRLSALDPHSPAFHEMTAQLLQIGRSEAAELARLMERHLDQRLAENLQARVIASIADLRRVMTELDPDGHAHLLSDRRVLGLVTIRARPEEYFARFAQAQAVIEVALSGLARGRDELLQSMVAVDAQRGDLRACAQRLAAEIETARLLGPRLEAAARELSHTVLAAALRDDALYAVRQRESDLLERMALAVQAEMALGVVSANAATLGALADKALATAVTALRTAVVAARVLARQDLVFRSIAAVQSAATNAIEESATGQPAAQLETLQRAFADLHNAIDDVDGFRHSAERALSRVHPSMAPPGDA